MEVMMQPKNGGMMMMVEKIACGGPYGECDDDHTMSNRLCEGISRVLSKWNGLQMAIQNEWGGHDSIQKSQQLVLDILSWFSQSKGSLCAEDLENLLHESLLLTFNTEIEDGSIEEIAEKLMIMHDDFLHGCCHI
uniref:Pre-rRNA-processing protein TSR2 homolog n=1 Tax=Opuntia streptacantha TaxID=393608 RepID=A0A7C9ED50_OPUST